MLRSGVPCSLNGLYRTTCACAETLEFVAGSCFPRCISCNDAVPWVYLQPLLPSAGLVTGAEAAEVSTHVRKLQTCLERSDTADPTLLFALGKALLRIGRYGPALEVIYSVLDHAPDNPSAHLELGRALLAFRQPQDALKVLERGAQIAERVNDVEALDEFFLLIQSAYSPNEQRVGDPARRVPLDVTVTRSDGLHPGVYTAVNISETGLCIRSSREEILGIFVAFDFLLHGEEAHVYAKEIWCRNDLVGSPGKPYTVGLQFLHPPRSVIMRIRTYLQEQIRSGYRPSSQALPNE